ncbi:MAG: hypothetical protein WBM71_15495, partial [Sedimenticolaceae bacterium]
NCIGSSATRPREPTNPENNPQIPLTIPFWKTTQNLQDCFSIRLRVHIHLAGVIGRQSDEIYAIKDAFLGVVLHYTGAVCSRDARR